MNCHLEQQRLLAEALLLVRLEDLPSRLDVEQICGRIKLNKAPGLGEVTGGNLKQSFLQPSDVGHALMLKAFLQGKEPLQWKGGKMHIILKNMAFSELTLRAAFYASHRMWQHISCLVATDGHWMWSDQK